MSNPVSWSTWMPSKCYKRGLYKRIPSQLCFGS